MVRNFGIPSVQQKPKNDRLRVESGAPFIRSGAGPVPRINE